MTGILSRSEPDVSNQEVDVPVAEITATTQREEARAAVSVVAGLLDRGVPVRDIVVVVRDLDSYEEPLSRAAIRHDIAPDFWTQINLVSTRPYQLISSLCNLFGTPEPDSDTLLQPLELGWTPKDPTEEWPIPAEILAETAHELPDESRPISAWQSLLNDTTWVDPRVIEYVEWVSTRRDPTPEAVADVLGDVVESYRETVLPHQQKMDSPALLETETAARAVVRLETLVEQVENKYAQRLSDGWADESWTSVAGICESLTTQRPGRREHANALALDVLEANDLWARQVPFVIAIGLVEGKWPRQPEGIVPEEVQQTILSGTGPAECLSPRTAWMGGRDRDQFIDALQAATEGVVVTHHTRTIDGVDRFRSSLLTGLGVEHVGNVARQHLLSADRRLPDAIRSMIPDGDEVTSEVELNE